MGLPVFHPETFEPTGTTLSLPDYFNPTINTQFLSTLRNNNTTTLDTILKVTKTLASPEHITSVLPFASAHYSANAMWVPSLLKDIYDSLPEELKYLTLMTGLAIHRGARNGIADFIAYIYHPYGVSYYETSRDSYTFAFKARINAECDGYCFSDELREAFLSASSGFYVAAHQRIEAIDRSTQIYNNDQTFPNIAMTIIRYATNQSMFYPQNCDGAYDWHRPSQITDLMGSYRVVLTPVSNGSRINFTTRPKPGDRRAISHVLNYRANVLEYIPYTIRGPKEPKATLYGVELEACSDYTPKEVIDAQKDLFFILKQDSSIWGSHNEKYEMVTIPASLKAHKRLWAEFFQKIDYKKFDTSRDTGNGMHVHIDRKTFSTSHLNRFTWFITNPSNLDFILAVSERPTKRNLEEWANVPSYNGHTSRLNAASRARHTNGSMRGAVHYKGNTTVEVRLFKGIVSYATIVKNLEFVDSVVEYTRNTSITQIGLKHYFAWLAATPANKYQTLKTFYAEVKGADLAEAAGLHDYLWGTTYDEDVTEKLNKAPFKVTNAHITILNKKKRKRTFILKDGKVVCVTRNKGILSKLDLDVQQKQTRGSATFAMIAV